MLNRTIRYSVASLLILVASLFVSCSDDPESTNEEEVITTFTVTLDETGGDDQVTFSWDDINLDGIVDASEMVTSGPLVLDKVYEASIQILNKSANGEPDITDEIREEKEEHIFCFEVTNVGITISNLDEDKYGMPLGLTSTWTAAVVGSGSVNITLRHQPGVKTGDCPGAGDTDADITFSVSVVEP